MFNTYKTITRIVFLLNQEGDVEIPTGDKALCEKYDVNPLNFTGELVSGQNYLIVLEVVKKTLRKVEVVRDIVIPI